MGEETTKQGTKVTMPLHRITGWLTPQYNDSICTVKENKHKTEGNYVHRGADKMLKHSSAVENIPLISDKEFSEIIFS